MEQVPTQLAELVGKGVFEIVPMMSVHHPFDTAAEGVVFTLNHRTYLVFEDANDGYRSSAGPLLSFAGSAYILGTSGRYPEYIHENVICTHRTSGEYGNQDDILEVRSEKTGNLIFRVGTADVDDYYPSFICEWSPAGLSVNGGEA